MLLPRHLYSKYFSRIYNNCICIRFKFMYIENANSISRLILLQLFKNPKKKVYQIYSWNNFWNFLETNVDWNLCNRKEFLATVVLENERISIYKFLSFQICENLSCLSMAIFVLRFHKSNMTTRSIKSRHLV